MWLFLIDGFYSVVEDTKDPDTLLVRARDEGDARRMAEQFSPHAEVIEQAGTDYRYRMFVPREDFVAVMADEIRLIDYPNFKDEVHKVRGFARSYIYSRVWSLMLDLLQGHQS